MMNHNKKYSVLSSVYYKESPEYLKLALDSMLRQTVLTDDYVIVKDGPLTKELDAVLSDYKNKYSCINIVALEKNCGLGAALNFGLSKCKNELVARMDTDDISVPDRCEKQLKVFNEHTELDIVGSFIDEFVKDSSKVVSTKIMPITESDIKKYAHRRNPFNHPTVMYKKDVVMKYGGYSEGKRGEDIELFTKMVFEGAIGYNIPESLLKYRAADDQFRRRSSIVDAIAVINVIKNNYKKGYIGLADLIYVTLVQCAGLVIPKSIGKKLFNKYFRSNKMAELSDLYIVNTPFHLMYASANAKKEDSLIVINGFEMSDFLYKMAKNRFKDKIYFTKDFYDYRKNKLKLIFFRNNMRIIKKALRSENFSSIYSFNDVDPITQWIIANIKYRNLSVIVEEGIGLYRDTTKRYDKLFRYVGKVLFGKTFENIKRIGESRYAQVIVCQEPDKLSSVQKEKEIWKMKQLDFSELSAELGINRQYSEAWFIGQPLCEDGILSEAEYIRFLSDLIEKENLTGKLLVKPHPREKQEKYGELIKKKQIMLCSSNELPVELLVDNSKKTTIYTLYSSAVRNFNNTKNVEIKVMYKLMNKIQGISEELFEGTGVEVVTVVK